MKGKKALILASIMLLATPAVTGSREPSISQPIDSELFQSIILPKESLSPLIIEPSKTEIPSGRPVIKITNKPKILVKTIKAVVGKSYSISGLASWYCKAGRSICRTGYPDTAGRDYYAAAGPALRAAIGGVESSRAYVGKTVRVCGEVCINVKLIDWCQCHYKTGFEKLIDLYKDAWDDIGGNGSVKVSW